MLQHAPRTGQSLDAAAQRQQAGRQRLLHLQEGLAQALPLGDRPLLVGIIEQVVAPVERLGRVIVADSGGPLALRLPRAPGLDVLQETIHVDLAGVDRIEAIAGGLSRDDADRCAGRCADGILVSLWFQQMAEPAHRDP